MHAGRQADIAKLCVCFMVYLDLCHFFTHFCTAGVSPGLLCSGDWIQKQSNGQGGIGVVFPKPLNILKPVDLGFFSDPSCGMAMFSEFWVNPEDEADNTLRKGTAARND